jgi:hypothetical protein
MESRALHMLGKHFTTGLHPCGVAGGICVRDTCTMKVSCTLCELEIVVIERMTQNSLLNKGGVLFWTEVRTEDLSQRCPKCVLQRHFQKF